MFLVTNDHTFGITGINVKLLCNCIPVLIHDKNHEVLTEFHIFQHCET